MPTLESDFCLNFSHSIYGVSNTTQQCALMGRGWSAKPDLITALMSFKDLMSTGETCNNQMITQIIVNYNCNHRFEGRNAVL